MAHTIVRSPSSLAEYFWSAGLRNREANAMGLHSVCNTSHCSSVAPSPTWLASHVIRVGRLMLKCAVVAIDSILDLIS